ncbi:MAG: hypothetical protein AMQ22_01881 [Candidatus Methanofastidiosum methylothiophilum]|uniref:Uncharacterized protein n=1 Tax=Candidatus Methanofastidiosum methylothiophilum TaxID=1705564 RepID=A0A150ITP0_9EURY|nr:MAG: hypothetical protein AMQ22_01881 [Candidatus Methanofastidiosum methylthiophilus]
MYYLGNDTNRTTDEKSGNNMTMILIIGIVCLGGLFLMGAFNPKSSRRGRKNKRKEITI